MNKLKIKLKNCGHHTLLRGGKTIAKWKGKKNMERARKRGNT